MRNDLQGLTLAGDTLLVVPVGLSEEEAAIWAAYVEWLEDQAAVAQAIRRAEHDPDPGEDVDRVERRD